MERFTDRKDAGRRLAARLAEHDGEDPIVLALPRGGVPVAVEIARALDADLDVLVVRKLGVPGHEEVAMGAVGEDGTSVLNEDVIGMGAIPASAVTAAREREGAEVTHRVDLLREGRPAPALAGRTAIIVDDGIATGATARAGCAIARARGAARVVLAVPVAPPDAVTHVPEADEVICVLTPESFMAVGMHYLDFAQVSDEEVIEQLRAFRA
ncbi:phosphoribosyltransferase family protein [Microbacterium sp. M28]|uniref:phosphoribosyltransferase n=1 Tax=Microbacterium sp. M28 TaxID=2962064 RepID=UPI0021F49D6D|nr:phosphoribosyltransferase family protein [Microbacterium sp. M28]UYO97601.1 phosphoribosyltransferase family protein [Microbacterium sp. M28]